MSNDPTLMADIEAILRDAIAGNLRLAASYAEQQIVAGEYEPPEGQDWSEAEKRGARWATRRLATALYVMADNAKRPPEAEGS